MRGKSKKTQKREKGLEKRQEIGNEIKKSEKEGRVIIIEAKKTKERKVHAPEMAPTVPICRRAPVDTW
jgi:hypothetical protein